MQSLPRRPPGRGKPSPSAEQRSPPPRHARRSGRLVRVDAFLDLSARSKCDAHCPRHDERFRLPSPLPNGRASVKLLGVSRPGAMDRIRRICLALPEAYEKETWGAATFRVRKKIFVMAADHEGRKTVTMKATRRAAGPTCFGRALLLPGLRGCQGLDRRGPVGHCCELGRGGRPGAGELLPDRPEKAGCAGRVGDSGEQISGERLRRVAEVEGRGLGQFSNTLDRCCDERTRARPGGQGARRRARQRYPTRRAVGGRTLHRLSPPTSIADDSGRIVARGFRLDVPTGVRVD